MTWLKRNWRRLVLVAVGAASALAAEHTVFKRTGLDQLIPAVVNAIPCTPGEENCPSAPALPPAR